jgi:hypothetical protein
VRIYSPSRKSITLSGNIYTADDDGTINIPDNLITPSIYSQGFVDAAAYLKQRENEKRKAVIEPEPVADNKLIINKIIEKETSVADKETAKEVEVKP